MTEINFKNQKKNGPVPETDVNMAADDGHLKPVVPVIQPEALSSVQYVRSADRDRMVANEVRRRRRRPVVFILIVCGLILISALVMKNLQASRERNSVAAGAYEDVFTVIETPVIEYFPVTDDGEHESIELNPIEGTESAEAAAPAIEHSYQLVIEDCSWTKAKERCEELGGHLVVISDEEEYFAVTEIADRFGISKIWIGCHRIDGLLVWETMDEVTYYPWSVGEPSYFDGGDGVAEDYILMWNNGRGWQYNDSRNDPVADYPEMYSGTMGFIVEFGD